MSLCRKKIPKALREHVWIVYCGEKFKHKCIVTWCENIITPFNFDVGHNVPVSKGGENNLNNLRPICSNCNKSMSDTYTIEEFSKLSSRTTNLWECFKFTKDPVEPNCP